MFWETGRREFQLGESVKYFRGNLDQVGHLNGGQRQETSIMINFPRKLRYKQCSESR